ncbi:MAG: LuxR C-terminal-related transcriptional regulator [Aeromicrobium erythreum]
MLDDPFADEIVQIADSCAPQPDRVASLLTWLCRRTLHDAAWLSLSEPRLGARAVIGSTGLDQGATELLERVDVAVDLRPDRHGQGGSLLQVSDLAARLDPAVWRRWLVPAGFRGGVAATLRDGSGQQVGFLGLLHRGSGPSTAVTRQHLERLAPLVSHGLSPMRALLAAARLVPDATSGVAILRDGSTYALPGLQVHPLLQPGSPAVHGARSALAAGQVARSFLWPETDAGHVRLTVLAPPDASRFAAGLLLLTPDADCRTLTPRELEVLGLLVSGRSNQQIAHRLAVTPRTVATHVEHVMRKLRAPSRTLAAVRAEREGLYVPVSSRSGHER